MAAIVAVSWCGDRVLANAVRDALRDAGPTILYVRLAKEAGYELVIKF